MGEVPREEGARGGQFRTQEVLQAEGMTKGMKSLHSYEGTVHSKAPGHEEGKEGGVARRT